MVISSLLLQNPSQESKSKDTYTFISNTWLKFGEHLSDAKQHFQAEKGKHCPKWPKMAILGLLSNEGEFSRISCKSAV